MTDEELAEIEEWFRVGTIYGFTKQGSVEAAGKAHSLIAEVRRLADRLNRQAEDLEVLREWIRDCGQQMIKDEKEILDDPEFSTPEDVAEGGRRIAALEVK